MSQIRTSRCATTCGCSASCWAKRCAAHEGDALFERVERVRALAKRARGPATARDFEALADELRAMPVDAALPIARAFAHFLNLANIAEQHHRVRRRRAYQRDPARRPQPARSTRRLPRLLADRRRRRDALHEAVCALRIELVLTAHPTEIMRRTLHAEAQPHRRGAGRSRSAGPDAAERDDAASRRCGARLPAAWQTEDVRPRTAVAARRGPRAAWRCSSRRSGTRVPRVLCDRSIARCARRRAAACRSMPRRSGSDRGLAAIATAIPHVTPDVTRRACLMARWVAADAVRARDRGAPLRAVDDRASDELQARGRRRARAVPRGPARAAARGSRPRVADRRRPDLDRRGAREPTPMPLRDVDDLAEPLRLCDRSLRRTATMSSPTAGSPTCCAASPRSVSRWSASTCGRKPARHTDAVDCDRPAPGTRQLRRVERRAARRLPARTARAGRGARRSKGCDAEPARGRRARRRSGRSRRCRRDSLGAYVITHGRPGVGRARGRAAAARGRRSAAAAGRAAVRNGARPARAPADVMNGCCRFPGTAPASCATRDARKSWSATPIRPRTSAGSPPRGSSTRRRRRSSRRAATRRAHHAVPRPRRHRRPRRRPDPSGDPVAAAGIGRRHAARHRTGRDDSGEVRPARHRAPHARGLHDGDAGRHARAPRAGRAANGARRWTASPAAARDRLPPHCLRRSAIPATTFSAATPEAELDALHIGSRPARRKSAGGLQTPSRHSLAVRLDADPAAARVVARRRRNARRRRARRRPRRLPPDVPASGRSSARRST